MPLLTNRTNQLPSRSPLRTRTLFRPDVTEAKKAAPDAPSGIKDTKTKSPKTGDDGANSAARAHSDHASKDSDKARQEYERARTEADRAAKEATTVKQELEKFKQEIANMAAQEEEPAPEEEIPPEEMAPPPPAKEIKIPKAIPLELPRSEKPIKPSTPKKRAKDIAKAAESRHKHVRKAIDDFYKSVPGVKNALQNGAQAGIKKRQ